MLQREAVEGEREISIREILWKIIFNWRFLLICALICATLVEVFFFQRDLKNYENTKKQQMAGEEIEEYEFTEAEKNNIKTAIALQQASDENQIYMENSILMNINPYQENVLVLQYYIDSDYKFNYTEDNSPNYTDAIVASYGEYAQGGELARKLSEAMELNCSQEYVKELISVENSEVMEVFRIEVVYSDQEMLQRMAEVIEKEMNNQTESISKNIGSHSLKLLSKNITVRADVELASKQKSIQDMLNSYLTQLNTLKTTMTENQLKVVNNKEIEAGEEETAVKQKETILIKPRFSVKYAALGGLAGLFLAILCIAGKLLFTSKIQNSHELAEVYGLRLFGILCRQEKISAIDKMFLKMKYRHKENMTEKACLDMVVSNIELTCKSEGISQIYITSSIIGAIEENISQRISNKLAEVGIIAIYGERICYDTQALRKMVEIGNAILLEQAEVSMYQEIEKEIRLMTEQKVKILGGIGINTMFN